MTLNQVQRETAQNGFAIRDFRICRGLSVDELAQRIRVTTPHMRNLELEHRSASDEHLNRIAEVLDVRVASLRRQPVTHRQAIPA